MHSLFVLLLAVQPNQARPLRQIEGWAYGDRQTVKVQIKYFSFDSQNFGKPEIRESRHFLPGSAYVNGASVFPKAGTSTRMILNAQYGRGVSYWYDEWTKRHQILPVYLQSVAWSEDGEVCCGVDSKSKNVYLIDEKGIARNLGFKASKIIAVKNGIVYAYRAVSKTEVKYMAFNLTSANPPRNLNPEAWAQRLIESTSSKQNKLIVGKVRSSNSFYFNNVLVHDPGYRTEYLSGKHNYFVSVFTAKGSFRISGKWKGDAVNFLDSGTIFFRIGGEPYFPNKFSFQTRDDYLVYDWKRDQGGIVSIPANKGEFVNGGHLDLKFANPVPREFLRQIIQWEDK